MKSNDERTRGGSRCGKRSAHMYLSSKHSLPTSGGARPRQGLWCIASTYAGMCGCKDTWKWVKRATRRPPTTQTCTHKHKGRKWPLVCRSGVEMARWRWRAERQQGWHWQSDGLSQCPTSSSHALQQIAPTEREGGVWEGKT